MTDKEIPVRQQGDSGLINSLFHCVMRSSASCCREQPIQTAHFCPPFQHLLSERLMSLGIMGARRVPPLNPSETIVLSEHYRL